MHAMLSAEATPRAKPGRPRAGEVDVLIGKRVRERRLMLGITVQELAVVLGVPYQQVHKYETGANWLSAGRLYRLAEALGVEVGHFFRETGTGEPSAPTAQRRMLLELVRNFARIPDRRQQEAVARLARTLAGLGEAAAGEDGPLAA